MEIKKEELKIYLEKKYSRTISNLKVDKLGSGIVGTGYLVTFLSRKQKFRLILKSLRKEGLRHDYLSDRASSLIQAHSDYNLLPNHIHSQDVLVENVSGSLNSLGNAKEFYILMDEAKGKDFGKILGEVKNTGELNAEIKKKILCISDWLVEIHKNKHVSSSLYRRKISDTFGGNGSIMELLSIYPENAFIEYSSEWLNILGFNLRFFALSRKLEHRLCEVHGDLHPGNIWFDEDKLIILDRARGRYGEPADDIVAFVINLILYSLVSSGDFSGNFKELFALFWNNYFQKTGDREMRKIMSPFFAFRIAVITNPIILDDNFFGGKEKAKKIRQQLINFALHISKEKEFCPEKILHYLSS